MKYMKKEYGVVLYLHAMQDAMYSIFDTLSIMDEEDQYNLTQLIISALKTADILDFDPPIASSFKTPDNNLVVVFIKQFADMSFDEMREIANQMRDVEDELPYFVEYDDTQMAYACRVCLHLQSSVQEQVDKYVREFEEKKRKNQKPDKPKAKTRTNPFLKEQPIYKVPARDIFNLLPYAECIFNRKNDMYIKVKPGVLLDELYERCDINEREYRRLVPEEVHVSSRNAVCR
ncbi:MAG: hypothetical protein K6G10_07060 [Butyrivibrio sp.]|nr:hypothetical protein [Butyrivibrio sp.]